MIQTKGIHLEIWCCQIWLYKFRFLLGSIARQEDSAYTAANLFLSMVDVTETNKGLKHW